MASNQTLTLENPQAFTADTLGAIALLRNTIIADASAVGLSNPAFLAGPIARELNKAQFDYPTGVAGALITDAKTALVEPYSNDSLVQNHFYAVGNDISNTQSAGIAGIVARIENPTLNDLGPAKIQLGAAMDAVSSYLSNTELSAGDPLNLKQFDGNADKLAQALINTNETTVAIQAVIARQAQDFFAACQGVAVSQGDQLTGKARLEHEITR